MTLSEKWDAFFTPTDNMNAYEVKFASFMRNQFKRYAVRYMMFMLFYIVLFSIYKKAGFEKAIIVALGYIILSLPNAFKVEK
jgi:hypothetical protein